MVYHPGILRDTLAFHGCAELFQVQFLKSFDSFPEEFIYIDTLSYPTWLNLGCSYGAYTVPAGSNDQTWNSQ